MKRWIIALCLLALLRPCGALAENVESGENDGDRVYSLFDQNGELLTRRGGRMYVDDEYISSDNQLYRVVQVDDMQGTAVAEHLGAEPAISSNNATAVSATIDQAQGKKLICMYSTHSDESYEPTDGASSKTEDAGIYDVGNSLKESLEKLGIEVVYSEQTHLPHDAAAYRRSRQTAEELLKKQPDALLDLHRDGIPDPAEYESEVDGEEVSQVRLLVGRSNPNADANRAFAKRIKAVADEKYPGLIKDIYVGKGNYNQELYPQALLLELGTHTIDKDLAIKSTDYVADVLNDVLFGGESAKASPATGQQENKAGAKGIAWIIGIAIAAAALYALVATGKLDGMKQKLARGASELTGGAAGKKPDDEDQ